MILNILSVLLILYFISPLVTQFPGFTVLLLLLIYSNFLEFILVNSELLMLRLGGIGTITTLDIIVILMIIRMIVKNQHFKFSRPFYIFIVINTLYLVYSIFFLDVRISNSIYYYRYIYYFLFYFFMIYLIRDKEDYFSFLKITTLFFIFISALHFTEIINGSPFSLIDRSQPRAYWESVAYINVGGREIPYIWNRFSSFILAFSFFYLSQHLNKENKIYGIPNLFLFSFGILSLLMAFSRVWLFLISFAFLFAVLFNMKNVFKKIRTLLIAILLIATMGLVILPTLFTDLKYRIFTYEMAMLGEEANVNSRLDIILMQLKVFYENYIFGLGISNKTLPLLNTADIGLSNYLMVHGLTGFFFFVYFIYFYYKQIPFDLQDETGSNVHKNMLALLVISFITFLFSYSHFSGTILVSLIYGLTELYFKFNLNNENNLDKNTLAV